MNHIIVMWGFSPGRAGDLEVTADRILLRDGWQGSMQQETMEVPEIYKLGQVASR